MGSRFLQTSAGVDAWRVSASGGPGRFRYRVTGRTMNVHGIDRSRGAGSVYIPSAGKTRSTLGNTTDTADGLPVAVW
jgi:hypothetical protein